MYRVWMQEGVPPRPEYAERPGRWVAEESWPSPHIESRRLALNADGIATEPGAGRDLVHRSPQRVGLYAGEWCPYGYAAEMPLDQRLEDGQSLCFDSPGLSAPLEILGAPAVELDLSVDRPNALIAARLSDVAPDGAATQVTYGLLNLTHRESHEYPEALEPGRRYRVRVQMNDIAHRFEAGRRLRVAISTTWWPRAWPSPEPVTLMLAAGSSTLLLPVREPRESDAELPEFPEPEAAPPTPHTADTPYQRGRRIHFDAETGELTVDVIKDRGRFHVEGADLTYSGAGRDRISIVGEESAYGTARGELSHHAGTRGLEGPHRDAQRHDLHEGGVSHLRHPRRLRGRHPGVHEVLGRPRTAKARLSGAPVAPLPRRWSGNPRAAPGTGRLAIEQAASTLDSRLSRRSRAGGNPRDAQRLGQVSSTRGSLEGSR